MSAAVLALAFGTAGGGKVLAQAAAQAAAPSQAAPSSPSLGKTLQRIQSSGVVVIGHRESSMPMSYVAHGTPMGYSVDVCLQVAQALGRHLKLRETKVAYRLVDAAQRGRLGRARRRAAAGDVARRHLHQRQRVVDALAPA